ncbi:AbrB/MazE/SpoVT family DNA-binding domain-containing protein [Candidatus Saccharibacteria bacterium]|nr:AbrB/MazE/SpoVT family DNA-binding domain-containing protein [Candidatus Saccharibacteria bacterium]NCU40400.1 AbrB/MazE/SpoVT family DNA-binding domain-containing protein [Candidatus Saccharibacteria bacterium]
MSFHKHVKLAGTVTVGPKGQVVIPSEVREKMRIKPGDKLVALYFDEKKSIAFITEEQAQEYVVQMGNRCAYFKEQRGGKE